MPSALGTNSGENVANMLIRSLQVSEGRQGPVRGAAGQGRGSQEQEEEEPGGRGRAEDEQEEELGAGRHLRGEQPGRLRAPGAATGGRLRQMEQM